jgi:hypothetical protein
LCPDNQGDKKSRPSTSRSLFTTHFPAPTTKQNAKLKRLAHGAVKIIPHANTTKSLLSRTRNDAEMEQKMTPASKDSHLWSTCCFFVLFTHLKGEFTFCQSN